MPLELSYQQGRAWAKKRQAAIDATDKAFQKEVRELEESIEQRCRERMLDAGFEPNELQLGQFVACLPTFVESTDTRFAHYKSAMKQLEADQSYMWQVLGVQVTAPVSAPENDLCDINRPLQKKRRKVKGGTKDWLTVTQAANISGASKAVISRAVSAQKLKGKGTGTDRRICPADLSRWQLEKTKRPEPKETDAAIRKRLDRSNVRGRNNF